MSEAVHLAEHSSVMDLIAQESPQEQKIPFLSRVLWKLCQCIVDNDEFSEAQVSEESLDESVYLEPQQGPKRNTLVLDLDETLVHSSLQPGLAVDLILQFKTEEEVSTVYVQKRPGLDVFLKRVGELFEVVLFTASLPEYANIVVDKIDPEHTISARLYRSSCRVRPFGYLKDLSRIGRDLDRVMILDNCPQSYALQPGNAIPISSWFNDSTDTELFQLLPMLEILSDSNNVLDDIQALLNGTHKKSGDGLAEATLRSRSILNSPLHQKTYRHPFSADEETIDVALCPAKRCVTDSGVHYS